MIFVHNEHNTDAYTNLALEEYVLRNFDEATDYLIFYINAPSIIIGRNQNTLEEINHEYVQEQDIKVVRRISGGGAVYHDLGNLSFSFITDYDYTRLNNFRQFTAPIISVLNDMGIEAELSGRNDIEVKGKKVSGNAQFSTSKRMFSHGTLLFDSDLSEVARALNVKMSKIKSKGHKSVRSRVANLTEFLDEPMSIKTFREQLLEGLYQERDAFETYHLTDDEWAKVHELRDEKYATWDWNYGSSPKFNVQRTRRFDIGEIDLRLDVEKGYVQNAKIYGDFFGKEPVEEVEDKLTGIRYADRDVRDALESVDITQYFGDLPKEAFISLVYGADEEE